MLNRHLDTSLKAQIKALQTKITCQQFAVVAVVVIVIVGDVVEIGAVRISQIILWSPILIGDLHWICLSGLQWIRSVDFNWICWFFHWIFFEIGARNLRGLRAAAGSTGEECQTKTGQTHFHQI